MAAKTGIKIPRQKCCDTVSALARLLTKEIQEKKTQSTRVFLIRKSEKKLACSYVLKTPQEKQDKSSDSRAKWKILKER